MKQINPKATHLLIRHNEIALKGKNRPLFERRLRQNLLKCIGGKGVVHSFSGRFVLQPDAGILAEDGLQMITKIARLGGITAVTPCMVIEPKIEKMTFEALEWMKAELIQAPDSRTFALRSKRVDKRFPISSAHLDIEIGTKMRALKEGLTVNLKKPDRKISIEVRAKHALIYSFEEPGAKGLPMDATQRVVCLLSGGIDSPVAAYEVMRRGCSPVFIHFHSKPFTSEASISKVKRLAAILRKTSPMPFELWFVPLLEIQKAVRDRCNERYRTIHYRKFMMKIAQELAARRGAKALVTGEAIGQVASQTLTNMHAIEDLIQLPILRPLVTMDKAEIVAKAKQIGTYETSIEPHDDTCVLFAPTNPATQAKLNQIREEAESLPQFQLVFAALDAAEKIIL